MLLHELSAAYTMLTTGGALPPPPPIQYWDFAVWQADKVAQSGVMERELGYWKQVRMCRRATIGVIQAGAVQRQRSAFCFVRAFGRAVIGVLQAGAGATSGPTVVCINAFVQLAVRCLPCVQVLAGVPPLLQLPSDRPRPAEPVRGGGSLRFTLSPLLASRLQGAARKLKATMFRCVRPSWMQVQTKWAVAGVFCNADPKHIACVVACARSTLMAAMQALLQRFSGQEDIVVGMPVASRDVAETQVGHEPHWSSAVPFALVSFPKDCLTAHDPDQQQQIFPSMLM